MKKHIVIDARIRRSSTGRYVDRLIEHLQLVDSGNPYIILVQPDDPWQPKAKNFLRIDCSFPQFSFNPFHQIGFAWQLYRLRPGLVHFPMNQQPLLYLGKVVTTTMDTTMLHYTRPGKTLLPVFWIKMACYRFLFWYSNRKSRAVIAITKYVKNELEQKYYWLKGRVTVTHCASEPPLAAKPTLVEGAQKPFIFYVGTAFPHKNLTRLVDAFEIIRSSHPELQLILAGKKEHYYQELEHYVHKSSARESIFLTGFVTDEQLKWLYQNAEAYVFPSLSEGFGLPALEAFVHGTPVVSSNATCLPEVCGDAAHYFDPNNTNDIAIQIMKVLEHPKLRDELIAKGHKQALKFSWQTMAKQTLEVYKKVLSS